MSYRTIKRVLGETNLERKCRWWFGTSLFILLSLSFFWYGRRTDTIVKELNPKFIGPELVRAGWLEVHLSHLAEIGRMQRGQRPDGRHLQPLFAADLAAHRFQGRHRLISNS